MSKFYITCRHVSRIRSPLWAAVVVVCLFVVFFLSRSAVLASLWGGTFRDDTIIGRIHRELDRHADV